MNKLTGLNEHARERLMDRLYVGLVVVNNDPTKAQRIKVTIPKLLEAANEADLPWILPMSSSPFGVGDNYGVQRVPVIGSRVLVSFQDGDLAHGVYRGDLPTANTTLADELLVDYPNRVGWSDPKGNIYFTDLNTNQIFFRHASGSGFTIEANGDINVVCVGNRTDVVQGDYVLSVLGDMKVAVGGELIEQTTGDRVNQTNGNLAEIIGGDVSHSVSGSRSVSCASESRSGEMTSTDDIKASGISLSSHRHGGVDTGSGTSGGPV